MKNIASTFLTTSSDIKTQLAQNEVFLAAWEKAAEMLQSTVQSGGTIYCCGNGGSACDAMHFREELVARYKRERKGMRAQHFIDPSTMSCWANDYEYSGGFAREAETFLTNKDCIVGISTSGNSDNVIRAVEIAKALGATSIGLLGKSGGKMKDVVDVSLIVPSEETDRIQEVHITLIHAFCEYLEQPA